MTLDTLRLTAEGAKELLEKKEVSGAELFAAYLEAYPQGRYAASAAGLVRRALWLQGETGALGAAYARMLERVDPEDAAAVDLVQEIDIKYLLDAEAGQASAGPWLVAAHDLLRLRNCPFHPLVESSPELVCGLNHAYLCGILHGLGADTALDAVLAPEPGQCCVAFRRRESD